MELAKRYGVLFALLISLTHCAGTALDPNEFPPGFCDKHLCAEQVISFHPVTVAMERVVLDVAGRWSKASGQDLFLADDGIPVVFTEHITSTNPDGSPLMRDGVLVEVCANTTVMSPHSGLGPKMVQRIDVDPTPPEGCPSIEATVIHEFVHALNPFADHATHGVFAEYSDGSTAIDMDALLKLCDRFDCTVMQPEP